MDLPDRERLLVPGLGEGRFPSPIVHDRFFVSDEERAVVTGRTRVLEPYARAGRPLPSFELAGPRAMNYFDSAKLSCGIVTCGGLCPGLNNVIRAIVLSSYHHYGVRRVLGYRYGYAGLADSGIAPMRLDLACVDRIHEAGGTFLGTSRGPQPVETMADTLARDEIGVLFAIGGDGTLRGASALAAELRRRGQETAVVGIPKTIDNDILWVDRSFGFTTAVETAREAIQAAHTEAASALNGIGLVKLMGRHSGFIAAEATLASSDVNFCLVPEFPFPLHGEDGLLAALERRLALRQHAVIVVAEGAGQDLFDASEVERDASGNVKLHDIGLRLRDEIHAHLTGRGIPFTIKYIDPSYIIRGLPANSIDATLCLMLGQHAVHAGMAGRTDLLVAYRRGEFVHVPIPLAVERRRSMEEDGLRWQRVLEVTGQGALGGSGQP